MGTSGLCRGGLRPDADGRAAGVAGSGSPGGTPTPAIGQWERRNASEGAEFRSRAPQISGFRSVKAAGATSGSGSAGSAVERRKLAGTVTHEPRPSPGPADD